MAQIRLNKDKIAIVDDEMVEELSQWKWGYRGGYAGRNSSTGGSIYMHRYINNTPEGFFTDHINGDKLDNRKANLRTATKATNGANRPKQRTNTSGYKGVTWSKQANKWQAGIQTTKDGKRSYHFLGHFEDVKEAAKAYNARAAALFGEFAIKERV